MDTFVKYIYCTGHWLLCWIYGRICELELKLQGSKFGSLATNYV